VKSIKITEVYEKSTRRQTFRDFCKFHPAMDHTFDKSKVNQVQTRYATRLRVTEILHVLHGPLRTVTSFCF
jgi:hypothetical protein